MQARVNSTKNFSNTLLDESTCVYLNLLRPSLRILVLHHASPKPES